MQKKTSQNLATVAVAALVLFVTVGCGGDNPVAPPPGNGYTAGYNATNCGSVSGQPVRQDGQPYYASLGGSQGGSLNMQVYYLNRLVDNYIQNVVASANINLPDLAGIIPSSGASQPVTQFCASSAGTSGTPNPGQLTQNMQLTMTLTGQIPVPVQTYSPFSQPGYNPGYGQTQMVPINVAIGVQCPAGLGQDRLGGCVAISIGNAWGQVYQAQ